MNFSTTLVEVIAILFIILNLINILLELYSNVRLERDIFVYSYLIRLILEKLEKKREIAYLSLFTKRLYNVRALRLRILSDY